MIPAGYVHLYSAFDAKTEQEAIDDIKAIFDPAKIKDFCIMSGHLRPTSQQWSGYKKWMRDPAGFTVYVPKGAKK